LTASHPTSSASVHSLAGPATTTSAASPPARACASTDLALAGTDEVRSQDGNPGDWVGRFSVRNTSGSTCRLNGWPGLVFFGVDVTDICLPAGASGPSCPPSPDHTTPQPITVDRANGAPRDVVLTPGGTTVFGVLWTIGIGELCKSEKPWLDPYGVHILVPGDPRPLTQVFDNTNHMEICGEEVQVTAFGAAGAG
jgi:hypothetical protein